MLKFTQVFFDDLLKGRIASQGGHLYVSLIDTQGREIPYNPRQRVPWSIQLIDGDFHILVPSEQQEIEWIRLPSPISGLAFYPSPYASDPYFTKNAPTQAGDSITLLYHP